MTAILFVVAVMFKHDTLHLDLHHWTVPLTSLL